MPHSWLDALWFGGQALFGELRKAEAAARGYGLGDVLKGHFHGGGTGGIAATTQHALVARFMYALQHLAENQAFELLRGFFDLGAVILRGCRQHILKAEV